MALGSSPSAAPRTQHVSKEGEWRGHPRQARPWHRGLPGFQPHITISDGFQGDSAKVEPFRGEIVLGPELFAEAREDWAYDGGRAEPRGRNSSFGRRRPGMDPDPTVPTSRAPIRR